MHPSLDRSPQIWGQQRCVRIWTDRLLSFEGSVNSPHWGKTARLTNLSDSDLKPHLPHDHPRLHATSKGAPSIRRHLV